MGAILEANDGDDVFKGNIDPWSSAYPEQTVMAYRSPGHGFRPDFFSDNDLNALVEVWGAERQFLVMSVLVLMAMLTERLCKAVAAPITSAELVVSTLLPVEPVMMS